MISTFTSGSGGTSAAESGASTPIASSKWSVKVALDTRKRAIRHPTSDDYHEWSLDQLKLECTARNLNVAKNTRKDERVKILTAWDTNKEGLEALLQRQHKQTKRNRGNDDTRTKGCMFRLVNVLFSDRFFQALLATGNQLTREEIDQGGSSFWSEVATAFGADTSEFNTLISEDAVFEDIDASFTMIHSAGKLKRMWKELSSNFACAEARSKVSGQGSHDFWDFCDERADVSYLDRWCVHRQDGREFCAANVYPEDEDDSTKEGQTSTTKQVSRKRQKHAQIYDSVADILERVNVLLDNEKQNTSTVQDDTWGEQKLLIQEQRSAQKLKTLYAMLDRNSHVINQLLQTRREYVEKGLDAAEIGHALEQHTKKKQVLESQIDVLEYEIMNEMLPLGSPHSTSS